MSDTPIRIEAEDMVLDGYRVEAFDSLDFASGKAYTSLFNQGSSETGTATTKFNGPTGTYDIVIAYYDEDDGVSAFNIQQNGNLLDSWQATNTTGGRLPSARSLVRRTLANISLTAGDTLSLTGIEDAGEAARIDYIEFVPTTEASPEDNTNSTGGTNTTSGNTSSSADSEESTDSTTQSSTNTPASNQTIRVEAEDMMLDGYRTEAFDSLTFASNKAYTSLFAVRKNETGTATTQFSGTSGTYNVVVAYFDEKDGVSSFNLQKISGQNTEQIDSWVADGTNGTALPSAKSLVRRTISNLSLVSGDTLKLTGTEDGGEAARVDYIEFVPVDSTDSSSNSSNDSSSNDGSTNGSSEPSTDEPAENTEPNEGSSTENSTIRIEAEDMTLSGYRTEAFDSLTFASNKAYTSLYKGGDSETGTATTQFNGTTGTYDIVIAYYDEDDGASSFNIQQNGTQIDSWRATNTAGGTLPSAQSLVRRTISSVSLTNGDTISLTGTEDEGEAARIDYIEFIPTETSPTTPTNNGPLSGNNNILEIMPLGDSITRGEDAQTSRSLQNGYRDNLAQKLTSANIAFNFVGSQNNGSGFDTNHEGHGGWKIAQLAESVSGWLDSFKPEIILLKIGTNDMGFSTEPVSAAINKLSGLIDTIVAKRPTAKLIVSSIAPVNPTNFSAPAIVDGFQSRVADYNSQIPGLVQAKAAQGKPVSFANIYGALNTSSDLSSDGFHPTESGYAKIADVLFNAIDNVLKAATTKDSVDGDSTSNGSTNDIDSSTSGSDANSNDEASGVDGSHGETDGETTDSELGNAEATGFVSREGNNLYGDRKVDTITGTREDETFYGEQGRDILTGGGGADIFHYSRPGEGLDTITDFGRDDFIRISAAKFTGGLQVGGALSTAESKTGVLVNSDNPISLGTKGNFLFNTATQILSYDRDGSRTRHSPIEIAHLVGVSSLSIDQFIITD